ncbi:16S rRNA (cytidine(1402)-2'-O)-methyltransferase [Actinoallomurus soli]|uniref:16S rRNA (cytidine(1402)-2'-O)-methyltransferase n=1 Tax=Actinoallomurus soli TaxID=2952535 RepID=UPI0020937564|nr:16S rRNA (cytidine(1402)-2'-O)-methyltransferase [Actinoallomurus soli]MCO5969073.1 16S rRNA (cytidine(1402)-2'-O)-methyltransferase [Actinoallomurus soli]
MARSSGTQADLAAEVARQVLAAAKYRNLDPAFVDRLAQEAAQRFRDRNQAVKYAKRKLHQAFGAFVTGTPARAVADCVAKIAAGADPREAGREAMRAHASSAERVDWLEPFYERVAEWCGTPSSVIDLACGLNPLAMPWMALAPDAGYACYDVDRTLAEALPGLGTVFPVRVSAGAADLVGAPLSAQADVALVLKTLTTVEQQRTGAAQRLIAALDCRHIVVSLPRRSLSGKRNYADDADAIVRRAVEGTGYEVVDEAAFGDEALYHLVPVAGGAAPAGAAEGAANTAGEETSPGGPPTPPADGTDATQPPNRTAPARSADATNTAQAADRTDPARPADEIRRAGPAAETAPAGPTGETDRTQPAGETGSARTAGETDPAGGVLTLVGTPIGNLGDLTDGALAALRRADVVCAEDTRRTRKLLSAYDLHPAQLVSVRKHNEERSGAWVMARLREGRQVAMVSDAGMPMLSDPGERLARHVLDAGGELRVAPGPDAATTALMLSGLPAARWCFEGFLPAKGGERTRRLAAVAAERRTTVLFEAPHRLLRTLGDLVSAAGGERPAAVLNDLTKLYERAWRGSLGQVRDAVAEQEPRGEFVIVLGGAPERSAVTAAG